METIVSIAAAVLAVVSVFLSFRKQRKLSLSEAARMGVDAAEQLLKAPGERLAFAISAVQRLDVAADGKRDWNDAQIRLAVEAEVRRRGA